MIDNTTAPDSNNGVQLILDTDMSNDVDDVAALAMIHALANNGEADLLAVVTNANSNHKRTASTVDAINTYYNRPDIPIGVTKVSGLQEDGSWYGDSLHTIFPHDTPSDDQVADAVDVLRATLAAAEDNSVTYVSVGYLVNMASLLQSEPDEHSNLNGMDLVRQKVKEAVIMGGQYPHAGTEWNFSRNRPQDTQMVVDNWPTRIVFSGAEIGWQMYSGTSLQNAPTSNPVRYAHEVFRGFDTPNNALTDGYHTWDQTAVLWAVRGDQDLWRRVDQGFNQVNADGSSHWQTGEDDSHHEYLVKTQDNSRYVDIVNDLYLVPPITNNNSSSVETESESESESTTETESITETESTTEIESTTETDLVPTSETGQFGYGEALQKSFLFYEANRSGPLPDNNRIEWRSDSTVNDGSDVGLDLTGGYFDAGDHVKFGFPMAASMTMLSWGVEEYQDAYTRSDQLDEALDAIKWGTDYFLKAHVTEGGTTQAFYGQVGNGDADHNYWGSPEEMTMARPAYKIDANNPGSDLAGETAAALASASIIFRSSDEAYAEQLLNNAKQLYEFAETYQGKYSDSITDAQGYYVSSDYQDELAWGAIWLYKATGDESYLDKAKNYHDNYLGSGTQSWDDKTYGTAVLLAQITGDSQYRNSVETWLDHWINGTGGVQYTEGGLAWSFQWGSLRLSANTSFLAGVYSDTVNNSNNRYSDFANSQIDYILGDNPRDSSYVVGFGDNSPQRPHHRSSSGNSSGSEPNEHILYGALVGGPTAVDDFAYNDSRADYVSNEVATDYNAAFTGALARMYEQFGGDPLTDPELDQLIGIDANNGQALEPDQDNTSGSEVDISETESEVDVPQSASEVEEPQNFETFSLGNLEPELQLNQNYQARATFYDLLAFNEGRGNSGYDVPAPNEREKVTAINSVQWNGSEASGAFLEVSGPKQRDGDAPIIVQVVDQLPERADGLDLSTEAFGKIADHVDGIVNIDYQLVGPPDDYLTAYGYRIAQGIVVEGIPETNPYYAAVRLNNHRYPIESVDLITDDGDIIGLNREPDNRFVLNGHYPLNGVQDLLVTDIFGQQVTLDNVNITNGSSADIITGEQFGML